jgi:hypothetical protein
MPFARPNLRIPSLLLCVVAWSASLFATESGSAKPQERKNADFVNFQRILGLEEAGEHGEIPATSTLGRLAKREMLATDQTAAELYAKFQAKLKMLEPHLTRMMRLQSAVAADEHTPKMKCVEFGLCVGLFYGLGFRFSLGVIRTPKHSYPVFGFKTRFLVSSDSGEDPAVGAALEFGSEQQNAGVNLDYANFIDSHKVNDDNERGGAVLVGRYSSNMTRSSSTDHTSEGFLLGLFRDKGHINHTTLRVPVKIPIYTYRYERELGNRLIEMIHALQRFDFELYDHLVTKFATLVSRTEAKLVARGLRSPASATPPPLSEHPLSSPGVLFGARTLLRYSPELAPDFLKIEGCDDALTSKRKGLFKTSTDFPLLTRGGS